MTERRILLRKISAYSFAITDLHLFLDTHPSDEETAKKLNQYKKELMPLVEEFEKKFGPLSPCAENGNRYAWIQDPWPWETEGCK